MEKTMTALAKWAKTLRNEATRREVDRLLADYEMIVGLQANGLNNDMPAAQFLQFLREQHDKSGTLFAIIDDLEGRQENMTTPECLEFTRQGLIKSAERLMAM